MSLTRPEHVTRGNCIPIALDTAGSADQDSDDNGSKNVETDAQTDTERLQHRLCRVEALAPRE
jgi:hypothetical protein